VHPRQRVRIRVTRADVNDAFTDGWVSMLRAKDLQVVLFSATFPTEVVRFAGRFAPNANEMTLKHEDLTVEGIKQIYLDCNGEENKFEVLVKFYGLLTIGSSIIFVKVSSTGPSFPPLRLFLYICICL
jgi:superfamily II DNA/RNA helicase